MKRLSIVLLFFTLFACSKQNSTDHLNAAKAHIVANDYNAATIELKNALKQAPSLAEARFLLGKMYLQQNQFESAEKEFNRALDFDYPANEVVPLLSKAYQKTGADNALIKLSHKQKGLTSAQASQVAFYKVQAYMRLKQEPKARLLIDEIKHFDTNSPFKSLALVYSLLLNKKIDAALIQLDEVIVKNPKQADALKLKANILLQQQKPQQAVDIYRRYVEFYPDDMEAAFIFARLLTEFNHSAEAEPIIDRLLKINANNMLLNQLKGLARFNAKDNANALLYTEKAIQKNPNDTALRLVAGISAYLEKNYQVAHQHLSFIADKLPPTHEALRILAASQLKLGLTLDANNTLLKLKGITSKDASLFSSVGLALVNSGEVVKAREILKHTPKIDNKLKNSDEELARLGLLQLSLNNVSGIINLESALKQVDLNNNDTDQQASKKQSSIKQTLATAYLSTRQFDKALDLAKQWKIEQPRNITPYLLAGLTYVQSKKVALAKIEFQQLLKLDPNNAKARMALITLEMKNSNKEQLKKSLEDLLSKQADFVPALTQLYVLAKQSADINAVIKRIKTTIKMHPKNIELTILLAKIYLAEQQPEQGIKLLEALKVQQNNAAPFWALLGQAYAQVQQFSKAKVLYQQWLTEQPNNKSAVLGNIISMDSEGKFKAALALNQKYLAARGNDAQMQLLQTYLLIMNGDFTQAQQSYDTLPQTLLENPFSKGILGQLQMHNNDLQRALLNLQSAYQASPNSRNARLVLICYYKLKQRDKGRQFLTAHVKSHPQDQASLMRLANEQIPENSNSALKSYQAVLKLNAKNGVAHNNIAYLYMQQGKLDLALQHAEQALAIMPQDENVLDTLGQIYLLKQDHKTALTYLSKAVANKNVAEEIYLNYIEALLLNKQKELAQRKIQQRVIKSKKLRARLALLKEKFALR